MGVSLAASAINSGHQALWTSEGRSTNTRKRAEDHLLTEVSTLGELCDACEVMVSVCPPAFALKVAEEVRNCGFREIYLDANAISPRHALDIQSTMESAGIRFVDGGIIGGPAWQKDSTYLYLSGEYAEEAADLFSGGPLVAEVIGTEAGRASALKMCYAAKTKGSTALHCAVAATAESLGISRELQRQWNRDLPGSAEKTLAEISRVSVKAWRFTGEMEEISETFNEAGVPGGFHLAAAEIFGRLKDFKDKTGFPDSARVVDALLQR